LEQQASSNGNQLDTGCNHQQECSSNQSGSDSGLGQTNSFSSDNSIIISAPNTKTSSEHSSLACKSGSDPNRKNQVASTIESASQKNGGKKAPTDRVGCIGNFNQCIKPFEVASSASSVLRKQSITTDQLIKDSRDSGISNNGADRKELGMAEINDQKNLIDNIESKHEQISPSKIEDGKQKLNLGTDRTDAKSITKTSLVTDETPVIGGLKSVGNLEDAQSTDYGSIVISDDSIDERDTDNTVDTVDHDLEAMAENVCPSDYAQRSRLSALAPNSNRDVVPILKPALRQPLNNSAYLAKKSRNVSFNQTVIVFCEEIESPSSSDDCDPPDGYQDGSTTDNKSSKDSATKRSDHSSLLFHDYIRGDLDLLSKILGEDASKLSDAQLFDLLDNESLLESVKFNYDDYSDEEDLDVSKGNSSCALANQEFVSDSESELSAEDRAKDENRFPIPKQIKSRDRIPVATEHSKDDRATSNDDESQTKSAQLRQTLPARMQVSTFHSCASKKRPTVISSAKNDSEISRSTLNPSAGNEGMVRRDIDSAQAPHPIAVKRSNNKPAPAPSELPGGHGAHGTVEKAPQNNENTQARPQTSAISNSKQSQSPIKSATKQKGQHPVTKPDARPLVAQQPSKNIGEDQNQTATTIQNKTPQSSCHVCRAIESEQNQRLSAQNHPSVAGRLSSTCLNPQAPQPKAVQQQPAQHKYVSQSQEHQVHMAYAAKNAPYLMLHNEPSNKTQHSSVSCASCRESLMAQPLNRVGQQPAAQPITLLNSQAKPLACQIVYVVDQNGNRVKALQVLGPAPLDGRQGVFQGGPEAPPSGEHLGRSTILVQPTRGTFLSQTQNLITHQPVKTPQPSIIITNRPSQPGAPQLTTNQPRQPINAPNTIAPGGQLLLDHNNNRYHTVYYVRQPLGAQNIRLSSNSVDSTRSFPDPHEVRRLDGIRGPTDNINLSNRDTTSETIMNNSNRSVNAPQARKEDLDDPTFGFSKRPVVKVFQSNRETASNFSTLDRSGNFLMKGLVSNTLTNAQSVFNGSAIDRGETSHDDVDAPPISNSQTLDRKSVTRRSQSTMYGAKENIIPSTSSMSNINRLAFNHQNEKLVYELAASTNPPHGSARGMHAYSIRQWLDRKLRSFQTKKNPN